MQRAQRDTPAGQRAAPPSPGGAGARGAGPGPLRGLHTMEWPRRKTGSRGGPSARRPHAARASRTKTWKFGLPSSRLRSARGSWKGKRAQNCQQRLAPPRQARRSPPRTDRHSQGGPHNPPKHALSGTFSITPKPISGVRKWEHRIKTCPVHQPRRNSREPRRMLQAAHTARRPPWAPSSLEPQGPPAPSTSGCTPGASVAQ